MDTNSLLACFPGRKSTWPIDGLENEMVALEMARYQELVLNKKVCAMDTTVLSIENRPYFKPPIRTCKALSARFCRECGPLSYKPGRVPTTGI